MSVSVPSIAADVVKYDVIVLGVLEALQNVLGTSGEIQGIVAAAVVVLTAVMSVAKQVAVENAVKAAK